MFIFVYKIKNSELHEDCRSYAQMQKFYNLLPEENQRLKLGQWVQRNKEILSLICLSDPKRCGCKPMLSIERYERWFIESLYKPTSEEIKRRQKELEQEVDELFCLFKQECKLNTNGAGSSDFDQWYTRMTS